MRLVEAQLRAYFAGRGVILEENVVVRMPVTIEPGVCIGPFTFIRERTVIRSGTRIGDHGSLMGDCEIGHDCRLHSFVHVSKGSKIGNRVFIAPFFVPTNVRFPRATDPELLKPEGCIIDDEVKIGANVTLLPGIRIGRGALVGAGSVVTKDVKAYAIVLGNPARVVGDVRHLDAYRK